MINYTLPDFTVGLGLNLFFIRLLEQRPALFQDGVRIDSVYGCFPACDLNGGRAFLRERATPRQMEEAFSLLAEHGVKARLTLTNMLADEDDLHDEYLNAMLAIASRYGVEAIVYADLVGDYVRERYGMRCVLSTTRALADAAEVNRMTKRYDYVVLDYNRHKDPAFLAALEDRDKVEVMVNDAILEGYPIRTDVLPIEEAKKRGAIALFGEKYGDTVRVVDMGGGYSVEFCGGTHLDNTAKAGPFHIESEFSVASGVRRIEATTGRATLECMHSHCCTINAMAETLKAKPADLVSKAAQEIQEIRALRHAVEAFKAREAVGEAGRFLMGAKSVGGLKVVTATLDDADADRLRKMGDFLRDKDQTVVAVLSAVREEKITFLAVCGKEAVAKGIKAGDIIRSVTAVCGGKGGGRPDSAMGGGTDVLKLDRKSVV